VAPLDCQRTSRCHWFVAVCNSSVNVC